jgi:hypothetical protein
MATGTDAFKWLEELTYNCEFLGDSKHLRNIQHELAFLNVSWRRSENNKADNYLEAFIEHANELIAACNHLRAIIAEETPEVTQ